MRMLLAMAMIFVAAEAQAACLIDLNNNVVCDDHTGPNRRIDEMTGGQQPNSRVETISKNKALDMPANMDAPINLDGKKPSGKDDCRNVAGDMISMCADGKAD